MITLESLKEQLLATENELEASKASVYRADGVIQVLKHLIKQLEDEPLEAVDGLPTPFVKPKKVKESS